MESFGSVEAWRVCTRRGCSDPGLVEFSGDASRARGLLRAFRRDPSGMSTLRAIVNDSTRGMVWRLSDDQIIAAVADLLVRRHVHLHDRFAPYTPPEVLINRVVPSDPPPAPPPRKADRVVYRPPPPVDPPTFPDPFDAAAQAAVLVAAAAAGAPFCPM